MDFYSALGHWAAILCTLMESFPRAMRRSRAHGPVPRSWQNLLTHGDCPLLGGSLIPKLEILVALPQNQADQGPSDVLVPVEPFISGFKEPRRGQQVEWCRQDEGNDMHRVQVITGANLAGKSVYLKQAESDSRELSDRMA